jgi:hypothetical protein
MFGSASDCMVRHVATFPEVATAPSPMLEDEACLPPQEEDEYLTPKVLLHIAYEVVPQLDNAKDFRWLSREELSLIHDFLVAQIYSL